MVASLVVSRIAEAYADPRRSARRILNARPTSGEALTMVFAYVAITLFADLALTLVLDADARIAEAVRERAAAGGDAAPASSDTIEPPSRFRSVAFGTFIALLEFFVLTSVAWFVGRMAGGGASRADIAGVVGWHFLAQTPAAILVAAALIMSLSKGGDIGLSLVVLVSFFYLVYMFSAFIAEAHGFEKTGSVMAACLGVGFVLMFIAALFLQAAGVRMGPT